MIFLLFFSMSFFKLLQGNIKCNKATVGQSVLVHNIFQKHDVLFAVLKGLHELGSQDKGLNRLPLILSA